MPTDTTVENSSVNPLAKRLVNEATMLREVFGEHAPKRKWVWQMRRRRAIPYIKIGGRVMYDSQDVLEHLKARFTIKAIGQNAGRN